MGIHAFDSSSIWWAARLMHYRPKRCMTPDGLTTDFAHKSLIGVLRADAKAAVDAERAETVTVTFAESEAE